MENKKQRRKFCRILMALWAMLLLMAVLPMQTLAYSDEPCADGNHYYSYQMDVTPTCTTEGHRIGYCQYCGQTTEAELPATGHDWTDWYNTTDPTCTTEGVQVRYCNNCREQQSRLTDPLGHAWGDWYLVVPTNCFRPGQEGRVCSRCDAYDSRYIDQTQHNWEVESETPASCIDAGIRYLRCSNCYTEKTEAVSALGHNWGTAVTIQYASCIQPSIQRRTCQRCGFTQDFEGEYADHNWGQWKVVKQPTAFEAGLEERRCQVCGKVQQREIMPEGTLTQGSTGSAVQQLQEDLTHAGFPCGTPDGSFGPMTSTAVSQFEESMGFPSDGIAWPGIVELLHHYGTETNISLNKRETSSPANGSYYTEGETIRYTVTAVNNGSQNFGESIAYDLLDANGDSMGSVEHLYAGESHDFYFEYTVTAADVAAGYVLNSAWLLFENQGFYSTVSSNYVISDTDGAADSLSIFDGPGSIATPISVSGEGEGHVPCTRQLLSRTKDSGEYQVGYCSLHTKTRNQAVEMVEFAADDAAKQKAWEDVEKLWKDEIEAMYAAMLKASDAPAKPTVMLERTQFYAMLASQKAVLKLQYPDQPVTVAQKTAEFMMNKSVDLCYEIHTAPQDRIDVGSAKEEHSAEALNLANCRLRLLDPIEDKIHYTIELCRNHSEIRAKREQMLKNSEDAKAVYEKLRVIWTAENIKKTSLMMVNKDEAGQRLVGLQYASFTNWLNAREALLTILYPEKPQLVQELLAEKAEERVMTLCEETENS